MKVIGIIAEYNPFHEGHKYQIEKIRQETNADYVVVAMSGDFVQRGMPALLPKHARVHTALCNGADLVLEIPTGNSTASAEYFASGAVSLLNQLGIIDILCFGAETDHLPLLQNIADILIEEPIEYVSSLKSALRKGLAFPAARCEALLQYLTSVAAKHSIPEAVTESVYCSVSVSESCIPSPSELKHVLSSPNNILAIEYLKALRQMHSPMKPYLIQRKGNTYHDGSIDYVRYPSASALRNAINDSEKLEKIRLLSECTETRDIYADYIDAIHRCHYLLPDDFSLLMHYKLLTTEIDSLIQYQDFPESLANRIGKSLNAFSALESFCELLKTRELTQTRIQRALLHMLLDIRTVEKTVYYARILGFRKKSSPLLHQIKKHASIPLLTKLADADQIMLKFFSDNSSIAYRQLSESIHASNIYESVYADKTKLPFTNEYQKQILIL